MGYTSERDHRIDDWADMEMSLGRLTSRLDYSVVNEDAYIQLLGNMTESLATFLKNRVDIKQFSDNHTGIQRAFSLAFERPYTHLGECANERHDPIMDCWDNQSKTDLVRSRFITFNYTYTLDEYLRIAQIQKHPQNKGLHVEGDVLHVHGVLDEDMILGVNDVEQIINPSLRTEKIINAFVKSKMNAQNHYRREQQAMQLIESSQFVIVYGMSIGITDKQWWRVIGKWLQNDVAHHLIIFSYDPAYNKTKEYQRENPKFLVRKKFLESQDSSGVNHSNITERIHVDMNYDFFRLLKFPVHEYTY